MDSDCGAKGLCLDESEGGDGPTFPSTGMCTRSCTSDAMCGDSASCSDVLGVGVAPGGGPGRFCFADCCAGDTCGDGFLCQSALFAFLDLGIMSVALYLAQITAEACLMTFLFFVSGRSVLLAVLYHTSFNTAEGILYRTLPEPTASQELQLYVIGIVLSGILAVVLLAWLGRRREHHI